MTNLPVVMGSPIAKCLVRLAEIMNVGGLGYKGFWHATSPCLESITSGVERIDAYGMLKENNHFRLLMQSNMFDLYCLYLYHVSIQKSPRSSLCCARCL